MEKCKQKENLKKCPCSYAGCERKGICCECVEYHRKRNELPACFFSEKAEKTFDRSFSNFIQDKKNRD